MANLDTDKLVTTAQAFLKTWEIPESPGPGSFEDYLGGLCTSVANALIRWQSEAMLVDVAIAGARASGGRVSGPNIEGLIRSGAPARWSDFTNPISTGLRNQLGHFERALSVPNLVWYPSMGHVAAAHAPDTLNLPCTLAVMAQNARRFLGSEAVVEAIRVEFGDGPPDGAQALVVALAVGLDAVIPEWLERTRVTQVIGSGPVPSFNPPEVPAGPVVGGRGAMRRGGGFF